MFNIGSGELVVIAVAALLILGPKRLPELARGLGKFMREFRRQTDEVRNVVEREFYKMDDEMTREPPPAIAPAAGRVPSSPLMSSVPREPAEGTLGHPNKPVPTDGPGLAPPVTPQPSVPDDELGDTLPRAEAVKSQLTAGMPESPAPAPAVEPAPPPAHETAAPDTGKQ